MIWQSPGIEEPDPLARDADEAKPPEETGEGADGSKAAEPPTIKRIEPKEIEDGSSVAKVEEALLDELSRANPGGDKQVLASAVRKRLTDDFGTIWHVAAGNDFVLEAAENRCNHML